MKNQMIHSRAFQAPGDIERVRQFLFAIYRLTQSGLNWEARRWEGQFYHSLDIMWRDRDRRPWSDLIRLWETADGNLVGVVNPEDDDDTWLQVHPEHRDLEEEMLAWAETVHAKPTAGGTQELYAYQIEGDTRRADVLRGRGYQKTNRYAVQRWRDMRDPVPELIVADGYTVRPVRSGDGDDLGKLTDIVNAGFGHHFSVEALELFEKSPSYNADLILVAEARNGCFVSHAGVTYNPETGFGTFEPVCTHPDHRRRGLAKACMLEGLHRLKALGATRALVGTGGSNPSNVLYEALGFREVERVVLWHKEW